MEGGGVGGSGGAGGGGEGGRKRAIEVREGMMHIHTRTILVAGG